MQTRMKWMLVVAAAVFAAACGDSMSSLNPTAPSAISPGTLKVEADAADVPAGSMGNGPKPGNGNANGNGGAGNGNGNQPRTDPTSPGNTKVELEGPIQAKGVSSITVDNQEAVVSATTVIRHGDRQIPLAALAIGDRVHVTANRVAGVSTLEAVEIHRQNPGDGVVDPPPAPVSLVSVTALDPDASENGNAPGVFQLARSGDASASLAVSFSLTGSATYGVDYDSPTSVTFPGGHATVNVTLTPKTDSLVEDNESATLTVTAGAGYNLGSPSSATVNIADHVVVPTGPVVTVVATDPLAAEDMSAFGSFTLTRTGNPALELVVTVTVGGSADEAHDYQSIGTSVRFEPGSLTASVAVIAEPDNGDGAETVILTVVAGAGYTPGTPASATVTIPQ